MARALPEARASDPCRLEAQFWEQWPAAIRVAVKTRRAVMNNIIWLVGAIVIVIAILSFLGLR
ncbi:MAG: hypothetical protein E5X83_00275 [Mesorhizobium sp.]|nr:MAG: hypothetical protein EOR57_15195 [Mesorhizobium sp.]RWM74559.1 MAG: hypothetical protein EOR82_04850 [Mesorhizobium sp.]TIO27891.1 MAG: hypothetical protein E5X83_00275 [Mesorhizobium sp.]TJV63399.1 MAG: hypothetical protein E5X82_05930 [Mesorhizobium sp.]